MQAKYNPGHLLIVALLLIAIMLMAFGSMLLPSKNSIPWLAAWAGVPQDTVRKVASDLGVRPEETASFGGGIFPFNYLARQLEQTAARKGTVTGEDVDSLFTSYVARCDDAYGMVTYYLYYSANVDMEQRGSRGRALVIAVYYREPGVLRSERTVWNWAWLDPTDSGFVNASEDLRSCGLL